SSSAPSPSPPPLLTLSASANLPCSTPLLAALREAGALLPRSRLTIRPAARGAAAVDRSRTRGGNKDCNAEMNLVEENDEVSGKGYAGAATTDAARSASRNRRRSAHLVQWGAWSDSTGARLRGGGGGGRCDASARERAGGDALDPGLLWRGPLIAGLTTTTATRTAVAASPEEPPTTTIGPMSSSSFPPLDGFVLRVAAAPAAAAHAHAPAPSRHPTIDTKSDTAIITSNDSDVSHSPVPADRRHGDDHRQGLAC
ncbi:unnamed protein product, partial [Scytosiphon promiscuus]